MWGLLMGSFVELTYEEAKRLECDDLSKLTMTYTGDGFEELKSDIDKRGQLVPIQLRSGKILDGRHRHAVCLELGIGVVCEDLGDIGHDAALEVVVSNAIHKGTETDASKTEAYLMCKASGIAKTKMPSKFSRLNMNYVKKLSFIERENPEYLNVLLHQNKVRLYSMEFCKVEDCGTINSLWRLLKGNRRLSEKVVEVVAEPACSQEYSINIEEYFNNVLAESEYWDIYGIGKREGVSLHPSTILGKKVAALIKGKYL